MERTIEEPEKRSNAVGFSGFNDGFILLGEDDNNNTLNDVWKFDPFTKRWTRVSDFPGDPRKNAMAFAIGNFGYVGAGTTGSSQRRDMYKYDIGADQWTSLSNYPGNGMRLAFNAACNGKAYAGGGVTVVQGTNRVYRDFYEYDPVNDNWRNLPNLPFGYRSSGISFTINDTIYFGLGYDGIQDKNDLWGYSVNDSSWTQKANFPGVGRVRANAFIHSGKAVIGGGFRVGGTSMLGDYYEYDPSTDSWITINQGFSDSARSAFATFSLNNRGYLFGGYTNNGLLKDLWSYGIIGGNNLWFNPALPFPIPRANVIGFSHNGYGYVTTGNINGSSSLEDFWKYDPLNQYWIPLPDFPGGGRKNAMSFVIGNSAYVGVGTTGQSQRRDMYKYDLLNNQWSSLNDYPGNAMRLPFHASCNGKAYVGGGVTVIGGNNQLYRDFYEYDPLNDSWRKLADLPFGVRSSGISFTIRDTVYYGLGYDGTQSYNDLWAYSVKDSTWSQKASFPGQGRVRAVASSTNLGKAIAGGGFTLNSTYLGDYYVYDSAIDQWTSINNNFSDSARATSAMFAINNSVFVYGGATNNGNTYLGDLWQYDLTVTGLSYINDKNIDELSLYPNPSQGLFYTDKKESGLVRVFTLAGKLVHEEQLSQKGTIDLRYLDPSAYLYFIVRNSSIERGKIVISK